VHCVEGTPGAALVARLEPREREWLIHKRRYSAFFATDLELLLRGLRVDTVDRVRAAHRRLRAGWRRFVHLLRNYSQSDKEQSMWEAGRCHDDARNHACRTGVISQG
jgi:hypothetical protein